MRGADGHPTIFVAMEPRTKGDLAKLVDWAAALGDADPISASHDPESGQWLLHGVSEELLDEAIGELRSERGVDLFVSVPQVEYREAPTKPSNVDYTVKRHEPPAFARVLVAIEPARFGVSTFAAWQGSTTLPSAFFDAIETTTRSMLKAGILAGFPVSGVAVMLRDAAFHAVNSTVAAFEEATRQAVRSALTQSDPQLLEPWVSISVDLPTVFLDPVAQDLRSRNRYAGKIARSEIGERATIICEAPVANLFGYRNSLRSLSRGSATISSWRFVGYKPVPRTIDPPPGGAATAVA